MVIEIRIWWITRSWSEMNTVTWSFSCDFNVVYVEWSYPWTFLFLMICVCLCVCVMCFLATCVCVCVMSAITQPDSDTPLCLIPSSSPPVSSHCCREDRTSVHTHQSQTHNRPLVETRAHTHAHTGEETEGVHTKYLTGQLPITQPHTTLFAAVKWKHREHHSRTRCSL